VPTILTHAALPLIAGYAGGNRVISKRLIVAGMVAAVLPDLDVIAFKFGIPYGAALGHRGASHSLAIALVLGLVATIGAHSLRSAKTTAFLFVTLAAASHGLMDMLTNGGRGVASWWPLSDERYFAPVRPVEVASIGLHGLQSGGIWTTLASEFLWLVAPAVLLG
jgi:inner membrane protein